MIVLDRKTYPWAVGSGIFLLIATGFYVVYAVVSRDGPRGGSVPGLIFGSTGSAMMLVALLLGIRKRFRTLRFGKAYTWMQAHAWLGLLSYPLILFHAGFALGGTLTCVLVWLFLAVWATGIIGLLLQQFLPGKMFRDVPMETIYDQIDKVLETLRREAKECVDAAAETEREALELESEGLGGAIVAKAVTAHLASARNACASFTKRRWCPSWRIVRHAIRRSAWR